MTVANKTTIMINMAAIMTVAHKTTITINMAAKTTATRHSLNMIKADRNTRRIAHQALKLRAISMWGEWMNILNVSRLQCFYFLHKGWTYRQILVKWSRSRIQMHSWTLAQFSSTILNTRIAGVGGSDMGELFVTSKSQYGLVVAVYHNRLVHGVHGFPIYWATHMATHFLMSGFQCMATTAHHPKPVSKLRSFSKVRDKIPNSLAPQPKNS